ncbi:MAG: excisionase family DNA-binding protein [Acidimicrobiales bacterium]
MTTLSLSASAARLRLPVREVLRLVDERELPAVTQGRELRLRAEDVAAYGARQDR